MKTELFNAVNKSSQAKVDKALAIENRKKEKTKRKKLEHEANIEGWKCLMLLIIAILIVGWFEGNF